MVDKNILDCCHIPINPKSDWESGKIPQEASPLFWVRSTDMWDFDEQLEDEDVDTLGDRQNSSGGFSDREK